LATCKTITHSQNRLHLYIEQIHQHELCLTNHNNKTNDLGDEKEKIEARNNNDNELIITVYFCKAMQKFYERYFLLERQSKQANRINITK